MANACFLGYKGAKPLGGVVVYNGLIPYSYKAIDDVMVGTIAVLAGTPFLATNAGKDPAVPF